MHFVHFQEYTDIENINFRFRGKSSPLTCVKFNSRLLQEIPMNEIYCANSEWRPDLIEEIMEYLIPQNVRIHVTAKAYENIADEIESWYGTKYKKVKISKEIMDTWNSPGFNDDLKLPVKNEFIATTFDIKLQTNVIKNIIFYNINFLLHYNTHSKIVMESKLYREI